ncbi:MAG TPA: hypothetical protein VFC39_17435, partial [Acidobacteriaceae bacterium]|nr:hypothetical protein [Acidobacteriaceae bacterium]
TDTASAEAPRHLKLILPQPEILILNLRDYPAWDVAVNTPHQIAPEWPRHIRRDDGLIAIPLRAGNNTIDIFWRHTLDEQLGLLISALAVCVYTALIFFSRSRRIVA